MTNLNIVSLSPPVAMSSPEIFMKSVDRVEPSELLLLHSRPTAIANWIHPLECLAINGALLLLSSLCVRSQQLALV
jgi:hypothetical protein